MNRMASDILIGDLLRGARLVSLPDLTNALQVSSKTGLPVGRVLVMLGLVTNETVQAGIKAQSLLRDQLISQETAMRALAVVVANGVGMEQALRYLGELPSDEQPSNKLGELFVVSDLVNEQQLADALRSSQHLGLPLGRVLVLKGFLSQEKVASALDIQVLLRDGKINRSQALEALRTMKLCGGDIRDALRRLGCEHVINRSTVRLGELLVLSGQVSETDLLTALETALSEGQPIGQTLISFGFIPENVLDAGLHVQSMISHNRLSVAQAVKVMKQVADGQLNLLQAVADVAALEVKQEEIFSLLELLRLSGFLTDEEQQRVMRFHGTSILPNVLLDCLADEGTIVQAAIRCHLLVSEQLLTMEQAAVALHNWRRAGTNLCDILEALTLAPVEAAPAEVMVVAPMQPAAQAAAFGHSWH